VVEEVVLIAAGTGRALQAADKQNSRAHRNQNGKSISVKLKPLNQTIHFQSPEKRYSKNIDAGCPQMHISFQVFFLAEIIARQSVASAFSACQIGNKRRI
jgi:hypothetical protein